MSSTPLPKRDVTSILSQELIDDIVDHASEHQETQRNLGLVNRSWSQRTRRNLFRKICFELGQWSCFRLSQVLQANPSLYRHIQTMRIDHSGCQSWNSLQSPSILAVINPKELVNVLHVSLDGNGEYQLCWGNLPPALRSAFYKLFAKPDLVTLALLHIRDIDASFLGQSRCLRELELHNVHHAPSTSPTPSGEAPPKHLEDEKCSLHSLSVGDCADALECFHASTIVPRPVALRVLSHRYDDKMDIALKQFSRRVETYEIICTNGRLLTRVPLHAGVLDLARLPKLKTLKINLHADQLRCILSRSASPLVQQLDRLRGTNSLEGIDISINLGFRHGSDWIRNIFTQLMPNYDGTGSWIDLDNTLSDRDAFPKLKKLRIVLSFTSSAPPAQTWNLFVDVFKLVLQKLKDRSMVEVVRGFLS